MSEFYRKVHTKIGEVLANSTIAIARLVLGVPDGDIAPNNAQIA